MNITWIDEHRSLIVLFVGGIVADHSDGSAEVLGLIQPVKRDLETMNLAMRSLKKKSPRRIRPTSSLAQSYFS